MEAVQTYSNEFLNTRRLLGDAAADGFIQQAFAKPEQKAELFHWMQGLQQNTALSTIPEPYSRHSFIAGAGSLPSWANPGLMQKGSAFFVRYAEQIMQLLGLLSLPYCYAAADGARVLYLSTRMKDDPAKRLADTAEFIWEVMSPEAFKPEGKGFAACLKIRLTHAAARYYALKSDQWNPDWGFPANQEDMAGTNLSFSLIVIRGLRKLGYTISYPDQQAFMHLWNVVGALLGLHADLIPADGKSANALEKAIRMRHFKASAHGRELTHILLNQFSISTQGKVPLKQMTALMRHLLGDDVADLLDLPATESFPYLPILLKVRAHWPEFNAGYGDLVVYKQKYGAYRRGVR